MCLCWQVCVYYEKKRMILNVNNILSMYKQEHSLALGTNVSNKQMHKRLKCMKRSLSSEWDEQSVQVDVDIGNGRILKMKRLPDLYWHLHVHALRKEIISLIKFDHQGSIGHVTEFGSPDD